MNGWTDFDKLDLVGKLLKSSTISSMVLTRGAHVRPMRPPKSATGPTPIKMI